MVKFRSSNTRSFHLVACECNTHVSAPCSAMRPCATQKQCGARRRCESSAACQHHIGLRGRSRLLRLCRVRKQRGWLTLFPICRRIDGVASAATSAISWRDHSHLRSRKTPVLRPWMSLARNTLCGSPQITRLMPAASYLTTTGVPACSGCTRKHSAPSEGAAIKGPARPSRAAHALVEGEGEVHVGEDRIVVHP